LSKRRHLGWQRLADVQVPVGSQSAIVLGSWIRQWELARAIDGFARVSAELGTLIGKRWSDSDERERQLLELQVTIASLTRWLVILTIVLGVLGVAGIGISVWALAR
jgi:hypothetical protein